MKLTKPKFWDYKKPNILSIILLPFTGFIILNNFLISTFKKKKNKNIKSICIGNIYVGGTAKTPISIKICKILNKLNFKTIIIKKYYKNQIDEQKLIKKKNKLYCHDTRIKSLNLAIKKNIKLAIFDDGLQDKSINYDLKFVCFNNLTWIGNGLLIPAGPLREKLSSISKYDGIFLNGNGEKTSKLKTIIKKNNPTIKIFETCYNPLNLKKFNLKDRYIIFSGIGNPDSFKKTLIKNKFNIVGELKFPDHYTYTKKDIYKIKSFAKRLSAKILTTEKDYIKIDKKDLKEIKYLIIDIEIKEKDKLISFIKSKI